MLLPLPLGPTSATVSPGRSSRSTPSRTVAARAGYAYETPSSRIGRVARARQRHSRPLVIRDCRLLRELEQALGNREPVRARVVLGSEIAKGQVELGREDEDGQRRLEPDAAVGEPHARR